MKLQVLRDGSVTRVLLEGRLDMAGVHAIQDQFAFNVNSRDTPAVVDCSKLTFITSLGIGMLVAAARALQRKGHRLSLLSPQPLVEATLRTAGIHHVIPIVHDETGAQGQG